MAVFSTKFVLVQSPTNATTADALSIQVTHDYGAQGFRLTSAVRMTDQTLLLCLVKEEPA
jgi:hypothetical protein